MKQLAYMLFAIAACIVLGGALVLKIAWDWVMESLDLAVECWKECGKIANETDKTKIV